MTAMDGNPAYKLVYLQKSAAEPERELKWLELVTVKGDWRYGVLFSADVEAYDRNEPTFQKIINSIKITDPLY